MNLKSKMDTLVRESAAHNADFDRRFLEGRLPAFTRERLGVQPFRYRLEGRGYPLICARIRRLFPRVLPRRASGCERLPGHPTCIGATASRYRTAGVAGSLGTGTIADVAVMGERRRP